MRGCMCYTVVKAGFLKSAFRYVRLGSGSSVTSSSLNTVFEGSEQPKKVASPFLPWLRDDHAEKQGKEEPEAVNVPGIAVQAEEHRISGEEADSTAGSQGLSALSPLPPSSQMKKQEEQFLIWSLPPFFFFFYHACCESH